MEGEYSDLSIEEKLNALATLIDLLRAGSSIRMEDPLTSSEMMSNAPNNSENRQLPHSNKSDLNTSRKDSSSPVSDVDNRLSLGEMQNEHPTSIGAAAVEPWKKEEKMAEESGCSRGFDAWIWKSFYSELNAVKNGKKAYLDSLRKCDRCQDLYWRDEKHCKICHMAFELDFDLEEKYAVHSAICQANIGVSKFRRQRVLSSQLQVLKAAIYAIEITKRFWLNHPRFFGWRSSICLLR